MKLLNVIKDIIILLLLLALSCMVVSYFIKLDPPASVVTTLFRMAFQIVLKYLGVFLLFLFLCCAGYLLKHVRNKWSVSVFFCISFAILFLCLVGTVTAQIKISNTTAKMSNLKYKSISVGKDKQVSADSYRKIDLSKQLQVSQCSIYASDESLYRNTAVIYMNYGGWSVQDESYGSQVYSFCQKEGYTFIRYACERSENETIADLIRKTNHGLNQLLEQGDFRQVYLCGGSAGAHIALLSGYMGEDNVFGAETIQKNNLIKGIIALYPCVDPGYSYDYYMKADAKDKNYLDQLGDKLYCTLYHGESGTLAGETKKLDEQVFGVRDSEDSFYSAASISNLIENSDIPVLIVQGSSDSMIAVDSVRDFYQTMKQADKKCVYLELPGTEHVFDMMPTLAWDRCEKEMTGFIRTVGLQ